MQLYLYLLLTTTSTCLSQRLNAFGDFFERLLGPSVFADPFGDASWTPLVDGSQNDDARALGPLGSRLAEMMRPIALFDPFAMMSQMLEAGGFEIPNVTLSGSECLVTVDMEGINANNTSIKVYSTPSRIELEISTVQSNMVSAGDPEAAAESEEEETEASAQPHKHLRMREGVASVSSFTTVRSFPAPEACNMTAHSSKATVDKERNLLLIKFPKKSEDANVSPSAAPAEGETHSVRSDGAPTNKAEARDTSGGWFTRLFGSPGSTQQKLAVPMVQNDEF